MRHRLEEGQHLLEGVQIGPEDLGHHLPGGCRPALDDLGEGAQPSLVVQSDLAGTGSSPIDGLAMAGKGYRGVEVLDEFRPGTRPGSPDPGRTV